MTPAENRDGPEPPGAASRTNNLAANSVAGARPARKAPPLLSWHRKALRDSAISDEVIAERGYETISRNGNTSKESAERLKRLGIPGWARREDARFPGLLIPLYRATGERISYQYRPDRPPNDPQTGKPRKYASPVGRANVLDVHPRNRDRVVDPSEPLWITEGVKKGDALTSAGACVVTLTGVFNWRSRLGTLGDWEDVPLKGRTVYVCFDADARTNANVGRAMARLGAWLKSKGAGHVFYVVVPTEVDGGHKVKGADDYLAAGGTLDGLSAVRTDGPPEVGTGDGSLTDAMLAEDVASEVFADRICWSGGLGWMRWDGRRWRATEHAAIVEAVRLHFRDMFLREVADKADRARVQALSGLLSRGRITAITELAKGLALVEAGDFDQHSDYLNTPTGVVDLTTGKLLDHAPEYLMTKMTAVGYESEASHGDWERALEALPSFERGYAQVRLGQGITGHMPPDDVLMNFQGGGANGKTTITGTVSKVLGDYSVLVSDRVLLADPSAHPTELMELRGARFALIEETPEARRLSVARLKKVVGTPQIEARRIRQDSVTFDATHSLFLSTNYRPIVDETDHGTWRRLLLLRFPYRFVKPGTPLTGPNDRHGDPTLRERLLADEAAQRAALRWLVDGARRWYDAGRVMPPTPPAVAEATRAWRTESDLILAYFDDRLVASHADHVMTTELLRDFNDWLAARGHRAWSDKTFVARFGEHDELAQYHIEKRQIAESEHLSLPPRPPSHFHGVTEPPVPQRYMAWLGVAFRDGARHRPALRVAA